MPDVCLIFKGYRPILSHFITVIQRNCDLIHKEKYFYKLIIFYINQKVKLKIH